MRAHNIRREFDAGAPDAPRGPVVRSGDASKNVLCIDMHFQIMQDHQLLEPSGALVADLDGSLFEFTRSVWTGNFADEIADEAVEAIPLLPWVTRRLDIIVQMRPLYINTGRGTALKSITDAILAKLGFKPSEIIYMDAKDTKDYIGQKITTIRRQITRAYVAVQNKRNIFVIEDSPGVIDYLEVQYRDWPRLMVIAVTDGEPRVLFDNREDLSDIFG